MKRLLTILTTILTILTATAQVEHSIILDQSSVRKMTNSGLDNANIDPIRKDSSRNACARVKIQFANMSRAEVDALVLQFRSNTDLVRQEIGYYDNILILEMTARPDTRFYVQSPEYGQSNEVTLNLEGDTEYEMEARLNSRFSIIVESNAKGAQVYLDGVLKNRIGDNGKCTLSEVMIGVHTLKLVYGGLSEEQQIDVNKDAIFFCQNINTAASEPQFVVFVVEPQSAVVIIENQHYTLTDGAMSVVLDSGTYNYTVTAAGYHSKSGTFTVAGNKVERNIELTADAATVTLTAPADAEIWVNGVQKGVGKWRGTLTSGVYIFEARQAGHRPATMSQKITSDNPNQSYTLPAPVPMVGTLTIGSSPLMADVAVDGKVVGRTPIDISDLIVGEHKVTISKSGYAPFTQTITITEGKTTTVNATLTKGGSNANIAGFEMVFVKGGTFTMGATAEQGSDAEIDEKPTHSVTLSDYYIGKYEVTQAQWRAVMGTNPSNWKGDNLPVEQVTWNDVQEFITKLNAQTGKKYRLPTEAEWEYAARGGNQSKGYKFSGSNSISEVAWYTDNSKSKTHPVGRKTPNELGIYDMTGNVWEWCQDWYGSYSSSSQTNPTGPSSGSRRVLRGGSWYRIARDCRVSNRIYSYPGGRDSGCGFRLVLSAE